MKKLLDLASLVAMRHRPLESGTCAIIARRTPCADGSRRSGRNSRCGCRLSGRRLSSGRADPR